MKITRELLRDGEIRRFTQVATATQSDANATGFSLGNDCQHATRPERHNLRGGVADDDGTSRQIARIESVTIDHDLATGNAVSWINIQDFCEVGHKSRSSYCHPQRSSKSPF